MGSPVTQALEQAMYTGSSPKLQYWAFRHPNPDAPPQTYRLTRRSGNGWIQLLAASRQTREVLNFYAETPEDQAAVREALRWFGIQGEIVTEGDQVALQLADGRRIPSEVWGGEKKKK